MPILAKACLFDTFGTVVNWEGSMTRQLAAVASAHGLFNVDWLAFTREWRAGYKHRTYARHAETTTRVLILMCSAVPKSRTGHQGRPMSMRSIGRS
jgi:hypothetical protein